MDEETEVVTDEEQQQEDDSQSKKIEELEHDLAVARADFYNFRQRTIKERQEARTRAQEEVITAMLPVLDNLDRALSASSQDAQGIIKGVEMVQRQFVNVLEGLGVSVIKS